MLEEEEDEAGHAEPAPIQKFRGTAVGSVLAAGMLGLRDVLEPPKDEQPAIVEDWAGEPLDDDIQLQLDPDNPQASVVVIRPQLHREPRTGH